MIYITFLCLTACAGLYFVELDPTKILPDLDALLEYNHLKKIIDQIFHYFKSQLKI